MKNIIYLFIVVGVLLSFIFILSCVKYQDYPYLDFVDGKITNQTLSTNQPFEISIKATKNKALLKSMFVTFIYDNDTIRKVLYANLLTGDSTRQFTKTYSFSTRSLPGIEHYTFSLESANNIITSKTVTIKTVNSQE